MALTNNPFPATVYHNQNMQMLFMQYNKKHAPTLFLTATKGHTPCLYNP